jgi:hypothetical protein
MMLLLKSQQQCLIAKDSRSVRWDRGIIQLTLLLWTISPKAYGILRNSGFLILPSKSLLKKYKNCFEQKPGFNDNAFRWMNTEAIKVSTDRCGGLILDEMAIQENLWFESRKDSMKLTGLVEMGSISHEMHLLTTHEKDLTMATHILQFIYLGHDGFRFPFAYFPSHGANGPELFVSM